MGPPSHVVVCGAGVIGACTAYFLSQRGVPVIVLEKEDVASAASGHAGGFLARDWCDGTQLQSLAQNSFDLHAELNDTLGARDYGYRRMSAVAASLPLPGRGLTAPHENATAWLGDECFFRGWIGDNSTTAQLDPAAFTKTMLDAAVDAGAQFVKTPVIDIETDLDGTTVRGVVIPGQTIATSCVVMTMGPWTCEAERWLPIDPIDAIKGDSIILRPVNELPPTAVFVDCERGDGSWSSPEIFPRPDGTVYVCGPSDDAPLPESGTAAEPADPQGTALASMAARVIPALHGATIERVSACYRPVTNSGLPVIGPVNGMNGAWIATGHGPWGILNAPATGLGLSEIIVDGVSRSIDLSAFASARDFDQLLPQFDTPGRSG